MKRIAALLFLLGLALFGPQASAQFNGCPPGFCNLGSAAVSNALSADGTANTAGFSAANTITLTTTKTNDIIIVDIVNNACSGGATTISDGALLSWTKHAGGTGILQEYWALSTGILTADVIAIGCATGSVSGAAFAINGANTGSPFDPNGAIPVIGTTTAVNISTTNANTFMFVAYKTTGSSCTPGIGWTTISNNTGSFLFTEFQIATSPQTALPAAVSVCTLSNGLGDAVTH